MSEKPPISPNHMSGDMIPESAESVTLFSASVWYMCLDCCHVEVKKYEARDSVISGRLAYWCPKCELGRMGIAQSQVKAIYV